jgi:diphthamide biosynthesis methyltransferase
MALTWRAIDQLAQAQASPFTAQASDATGLLLYKLGKVRTTSFAGNFDKIPHSTSFRDKLKKNGSYRRTW